jgi:hypothetical protein
MAMFQNDPVKTLAADLAGKIVERDRLVGRLADAVAAVSSATLAATALAVDGADDKELDRAESKLRALSDRVTTLQSALVKVESTVATLEREYADHLDQKTRRETSVECEAMAARIEKLGRAIAPLMTELAEVTGRASSAEIWDARGLNTFAQNCVLQIPDGVGLVASATREHGTRVVAGLERRATLLAPTVPAKTVAVVPPAVVRVFATKPVMWTDAQGQRQTAGKYSDIDLPPKVAKAALASGVCREIGSDVWRQWSGSKGFANPDPSECENLDLVSDVVKTDAVIDGQFTRIDRGKPFEVSVLRKA